MGLQAAPFGILTNGPSMPACSAVKGRGASLRMSPRRRRRPSSMVEKPSMQGPKGWEVQTQDVWPEASRCHVVENSTTGARKQDGAAAAVWLACSNTWKPRARARKLRFGRHRAMDFGLCTLVAGPRYWIPECEVPPTESLGLAAWGVFLPAVLS